MNTRPFLKKKVILFDWNRTLVNTSAAFDTAFIDVIEQYTGRWDQDMDDASVSASVSSSILSAYKAEWKRLRQQRGKRFHYEQSALDCLRQALKELPFATDDHSLTKLHHRIRDEQHASSQLLPGARQVLQTLSRTHTLAIISNSERIHLKRAGVEDLIPPELCFTAPRNGKRKPDPSLFHHALRKLNTPPSDCLMVGNSWRTDIRGAKAAQIDAVWIHRRSKKPYSMRRYGKIQVAVIRSLPKLLPLLQDT